MRSQPEVGNAHKRGSGMGMPGKHLPRSTRSALERKVQANLST